MTKQLHPTLPLSVTHWQCQSTPLNTNSTKNIYGVKNIRLKRLTPTSGKYFQIQHVASSRVPSDTYRGEKIWFIRLCLLSLYFFFNILSLSSYLLVHLYSACGSTLHATNVRFCIWIDISLWYRICMPTYSVKTIHAICVCCVHHISHDISILRLYVARLYIHIYLFICTYIFK